MEVCALDLALAALVQVPEDVCVGLVALLESYPDQLNKLLDVRVIHLRFNNGGLTRLFCLRGHGKARSMAFLFFLDSWVAPHKLYQRR